MAEREIPEVEQYLSSAKQVALELGRTLHAKSEQDILTGFGKVLESAASFYTSHLYDGAGDNPQIDSEIIEIMSSKPADTELSEKMAAGRVCGQVTRPSAVPLSDSVLFPSVWPVTHTS